MPELSSYTTPCADGRREFVDIMEALHYHALANGDGCWRNLLSHAAIEIKRLNEECERHRRANLLRAVLQGWESIDEGITQTINADDWDEIPWRVAQAAIDAMQAERAALDNGHAIAPPETPDSGSSGGAS